MNNKMLEMVHGGVVVMSREDYSWLKVINIVHDGLIIIADDFSPEEIREMIAAYRENKS